MARIEKPLNEKTDGSFPGLRVQPSPFPRLGDSASASLCSGWVHCKKTWGSCLFKEMVPWEPAEGQPQGPGWQRAGQGRVDASAGAGGGWGNFPREAGRRGDSPGAGAEDRGPSFSGEKQLLGLMLCDQLWEGWPGRDRERPRNRNRGASGEGEPSALGHLPCHRCTRHSYTRSPRGRGVSRGTLILLPERSADGDKLPHPHPPWLWLAGTSSGAGWEGPLPSLRPLCPQPTATLSGFSNPKVCGSCSELGGTGQGEMGLLRLGPVLPLFRF